MDDAAWIVTRHSAIATCLRHLARVPIDQGCLQLAARIGTMLPQPAEVIAQNLLDEASALGGITDDGFALDTDLRYPVAAALTILGERPAGFLPTVDHLQSCLRQEGVHESAWRELVAALVLRAMQPSIDLWHSQVGIIRSLQRSLPSFHWWQTGRGNLGLCAALSCLDGNVERVRARIESAHGDLRRRGNWRGSHTAIAVDLLQLLGNSPGDTVRALASIRLELAAAGVPLSARHCEALAALALVGAPLDDIARRVRILWSALRSLDHTASEAVRWSVALELCATELMTQIGSRDSAVWRRTFISCLLQLRSPRMWSSDAMAKVMTRSQGAQ